MKYRCVVFDLDGTLIDSRVDLANAVNAMRRHYSLVELPVQTIVSFIGDGARKLVERSLLHDNAPVDKTEATAVTLDFYQKNICVNTHFYPRVIETVKALRAQGLKTVVFTNKPQASTNLIAETLGFSELFDLVMGPEEAGGLKPNPAGLERCLRDFSLKTEEILMVGDHHTDLHAAGALEIDSCFVTYGYGRIDDAKSTYIIDDMFDLLAKMSL